MGSNPARSTTNYSFENCLVFLYIFLALSATAIPRVATINSDKAAMYGNCGTVDAGAVLDPSAITTVWLL